jgi:signal transduction histidine kinase
MSEVENFAPGPVIDLSPSVDRSHLLLELSREITSSLDLQEVLDKSFIALRQLLSFGGGAIQLIDGDALIPVATDPVMTEEAKQVRIPVGQGISGSIAATGVPVYISDILTDPRVGPQKAKGVSSGVRSYFGVPLILQGHPVGVLQIDSPVNDAFDAQTRALILAFVPTIAAAVQNAQLFERERDALERLQETEQLQRDFLAVVSHELRTPLTSVSGFGLTLADHAHSIDVDTIADMGQRIWRASRRLERVMGDLLDLSRIERGALSADPIPTDIEPILRAGVGEQTHVEHPIVLELATQMPEAMVDGERLHQILGNLLSNARKFSPAGTTITVTARPTGGAIELTVADHGRGIPAAMLERVFDRFFQGEPAATRTADGLGIGLYIVKQLCEHMDATIELRSAVGQGTSCIVRIPIAA